MVVVVRGSVAKATHIKSRGRYPMRTIRTSFNNWLLPFSALLGLSASHCASAGEGGDSVASTSSALTATPPDPVAFCKSSGLNVIIGTQSNDTLTGTAAADCIVGLGSQDTINGLAGND